jgi:hypothetical protein
MLQPKSGQKFKQEIQSAFYALNLMPVYTRLVESFGIYFFKLK